LLLPTARTIPSPNSSKENMCFHTLHIFLNDSCICRLSNCTMFNSNRETRGKTILITCNMRGIGHVAATSLLSSAPSCLCGTPTKRTLTKSKESSSPAKHLRLVLRCRQCGSFCPWLG
jgi:hypothetical protein